jgi:hypothetical protein
MARPARLRRPVEPLAVSGYRCPAIATDQVMRRAVIVLLALLPVAACTGPYGQAPRSVSLATTPDAPGFLVVGFAEQNYRWGLVTSTRSISLTFTSPGHDPVTATRKGCGSFGGFVGTSPCDLSVLSPQVLRLPAGDWSLAGFTLAYTATTGDHELHSSPALTVHVGPGEIVDIGDYVFASDGEKQEIKLVSHGRDDAGTRAALAAYPSLRAAPVSYKGDGR